MDDFARAEMERLTKIIGQYDESGSDDNRLDEACQLVEAIRKEGESYLAYHGRSRSDEMALRKDFDHFDALALGRRLDQINESLEVLVAGQIAMIEPLHRIARVLEARGCNDGQ